MYSKEYNTYLDIPNYIQRLWISGKADINQHADGVTVSVNDLSLISIWDIHNWK